MSDARGAYPVRRRRLSGNYGLRPCPKCGHMNGKLQRDRSGYCVPGVGCKRGHFDRGIRGV